MAKKQNKWWVAGELVDLLALDSSKQGPTLADMQKVKDTPPSAYAGARVAYAVSNVLQTLNQDLDLWTERNMEVVSLRAGQIFSLPFQLGESTSTALYEALVKPFGKLTGLKVTPPKEKEHDNNEDDHDNDLDNDHGLTQDEIEELLAEIEQEEANQDEDMIDENENEDIVLDENDNQWAGAGEDYVN